MRKQSNHKTKLMLATVGAVTALLLSGCREEEQGRILVETKGVYQGPADQTLSSEDLRELRQRGEQQKF